MLSTPTAIKIQQLQRHSKLRGVLHTLCTHEIPPNSRGLSQQIASCTLVDAPLLLVKTVPAGHGVEPEPEPPTYSLLHAPPRGSASRAAASRSEARRNIIIRHESK